MKVIGFTEFGGPEVLGVHEVAEPHADPGQVRVRVRAATVNPADSVHRSGQHGGLAHAQEPPYVVGMELAGVVDEVGPGAPWRTGNQVMAMTVPHRTVGAYAEHVVLDAGAVARIPANATLVEAATLPMNGLTARLALDTLDLPHGATLLVTGAAGAAGGYVVQLARADGLTVIGDASDHDRSLVDRLGAHVVVPRGDAMTTAVQRAVPDGVDAVVDTALLGTAVLPAVRDGGSVIAVRAWPYALERGITVRRIQVSDYADSGDRLDRLRHQVEDGVLTLRVAGTYAAERAVLAHRTLESGGVRGRLVLTFA